jgi:hypothetical protein
VAKKEANRSSFSSGIEVPPTIHRLQEGVNRILRDVRERTGRPVLAIVDGMDRLEFDPVKQIYEHNDILLGLECSAVFTCPLSIALSTEIGQVLRNFEGIYNLPSIKVDSRDGRPYVPGRDKLKQEMVAKRARVALFETGALDLIIEMSAGIMRDLIVLARRSCVIAKSDREDMVRLSAVNRAIDEEFGVHYQRNLNRRRVEALQVVQESKSLVDITDDKMRADLLRLMAIVEYRNGGQLWYAVHPIVRRLLGW